MLAGFLNTYCQIDDVFCPIPVPPTQFNIQREAAAGILQQGKGAYKPAINAPGQYFRVLFVFAQFSGDNAPSSNWLSGSLPVWAGDLVDPTPNSYRPLSVSKYWDEKSFGNFDVVGTVYPTVVTLQSEGYYQANGKNFSYCNQDVINAIDPTVNFNDYDKWGFNSSTGQWEFQPDGYVDMVIITYRNHGRWLTQKYTGGSWGDAGITGFSGIAALAGASVGPTTYTTAEGKIIDTNLNLSTMTPSGITITNGMKYGSVMHFNSLLAHEMGHFLFGYFHTSDDSYGIMSNSQYLRCIQISSLERVRLGYQSFTNVVQDNQTVVLPDIISSPTVI